MGARQSGRYHAPDVAPDETGRAVPATLFPSGHRTHADVRQAIIDGYITGTVNQDPYPQAVEAMHMAWLYLNGREAEIPKPHIAGVNSSVGKAGR